MKMTITIVITDDSGNDTLFKLENVEELEVNETRDRDYTTKVKYNEFVLTARGKSDIE